MPTNSIKGFKVGNEVRKYDYNELDNLPENDPDDLAEEVNDLKSDIDDYTGELFLSSAKDISNTYYTAMISNGTWVRDGRCAVIPVPDEVVKISVTANNSLSTDIAFLTSNAHGGNTVPNYVVGTGIKTISTGTSQTFRKPELCTYLYILKSTTEGGEDRVPSEVVFYTLKDVLLLDSSLTVSGDAADAKITGDNIRELKNILYNSETKDISSTYYTAQIINDSWARSGRCAIIPVPDEVVKISVTANNTLSTDIAFLTSNSHNGNTTPSYVTDTGLITISANATKEISKPVDCKYLYILKSTVDGGTDRVPSEIVYYTNKEISATVIPLGLHEMPRNTSALNIVKRCRQMTDIKWTPAVDLHRYMAVQRGDDIPATAETENYLGTFKAGIEYKGVPYGRVNATMTAYGYEYATVGHYIDFETFISSIMNPNTLLSFNNVGSVANHRSVIYATVCSGMTCYALDVPEVPTANIPSISGLTLIGKINDNNTLLDDTNFMIGDVFNLQDYHTAIITDIIRDSDGNMQYIELSDASTAGLADKTYDDGLIGGICRRKGWTRNQIYDTDLWGSYSLYRYNGTVSYEPSPYVNIGDEFDMQRIEHFPCMPYEGNKFVYKTGHIPNNAIRIQIMLSDYAYLKVFKNGTEISGSPFAIAQGAERINIPEISVGEYSAYLCNITDGNVVNLTYPCKWTIT